MEQQSSLEEYSHFFEVHLGQFDGPIDLLLHLVKKNELPIEELSLATIASQYLGCIEAMQQYDLEIAGEYLVIAATLLSIKSSILLNEPVELIEDEDGNLVNAHAELLRKLREAQIYREGAQKLGGRSLLGVDVFAPPTRLGVAGDGGIEALPAVLRQHDAILLGMAFKKLLDRVGPTQAQYTITFDAVTIVERMMSVLDTLRQAGGVMSFARLVPDLTSRASVIASFLALLELCKRQAIDVQQSASLDEITIFLTTDGRPMAALSSEFDDLTVKDVERTGTH